jgi:hypothetical protein
VVSVLGALSDAAQTKETVDAFVESLVVAFPEAVPALVESLAKGAPEIAFGILKTLADPQFWVDVVEAFAQGIADGFQSAAKGGESGNAVTGQVASVAAVTANAASAASRSRMTGRGGKLYLEIDADSVSDSFRQLAGRGYAWS